MSATSYPRFTVLAGRVLLASLCLIGAEQALAQAAAAPVAAAASAPAVTPGIPGVVAAGTRIELIKEGFTGTEGPVTLPDGSLIFTERIQWPGLHAQWRSVCRSGAQAARGHRLPRPEGAYPGR